MESYIKSYLSILPESQRKRFEELIDVGEHPVSGSEGEIEERIRDLLSKIGQQKMTMQLRLQGEETDSEAYNLTMREIVADLNSLYIESNLLDRLIVNHEQLNKAILGNLYKDLRKIENRIDTLNLLADNIEGYGTACREDFSSPGINESREEFSALFIDRDGREIPHDAEIDTFEGALKLRSSAKYDRIHTEVNGQPTTVAKIEILEQTGEGFSDKDPNYGPEKALDGKPDSFWGEVILADGVLKVPLQKGAWAGISGGALCAFKIIFPNPCTVNQFSIVPYCEHPFEIVCIGYTRDDSNNIAGWCGSFSPDQTAENPVFVDDGLSVDFPAVNAKALIVVIRQRHAYKNIYRVTRQQLYNKEMWNKIIAAERKLTLSTPWVDGDSNTTNPTLTDDKVAQFDATWQAYLKEVSRHDSRTAAAIVAGVLTALGTGSWIHGIAMHGIISPKGKLTAPEFVTAEKYEYVYGAYEIGAFGNEYSEESVFVSRPHHVGGNVQRVVLEAEEEHPIFPASISPSKLDYLRKKGFDENLNIIDLDEPLRRTSIEYYVSCGDSPNDPWYPILPLGQTYVNNEFLLFSTPGQPLAELRFYCALIDGKMPRLYKNEMPLEFGHDWLLHEKEPGKRINNERVFTYKIVEVLPHVWDPTAMYTIDYYPDESVYSAHEIDFLSSVAINSKGQQVAGASTKEIVEYFNLTPDAQLDKNCSAKLKYYPYVDRGKLFIYKDGRMQENYFYNPVRVTLNPAEKITSANRDFYYLEGKTGVIKEEVTGWSSLEYGERDPRIDRPNPPIARTLNVTDYSSPDIPVLNPYNPEDDVPTFEYYHSGQRVYFQETFRHDSIHSQENYGDTHGNAIIKVQYEYLVSGVRMKIILRRSKFDGSITPKVKRYALKFKVLY